MVSTLQSVARVRTDASNRNDETYKQWMAELSEPEERATRWTGLFEHRHTWECPWCDTARVERNCNVVFDFFRMKGRTEYELVCQFFTQRKFNTHTRFSEVFVSS